MESDLLLRWFVGLGAHEPMWDASTFSKNRDRLLEGHVAARCLVTLMARPRVKRLLSSDHFSVDGTMIQAWSSMKSVKPRDSSGDEPPPRVGVTPRRTSTARRAATPRMPTIDPEAKLYCKNAGTEARLAFLGHALMENRCGLVIDACLTQANGHAERLAALAMVEKRADRPRAITLGAEKSYDTSDFVNELRSMNVRPHVARGFVGSAIDRRTTRYRGYGASQRIRKRIEEPFG